MTTARRMCVPFALLVMALAARPLFAAGKSAQSDAGEGTLVVLNKAEASASLIDLRSGTVVATLPTADGPHEAAVSPDGRTAVVTNYGGSTPGSTLTLLDVPAAKAAGTIDLGTHRRPHGVAWLPDGRHVVVTAETSKALLIVDVKEARVAAVIPTGQEVSHMVAVTSDGKRAFVANIGSGSVTAVDLESRTALRTIPTGSGAEGIALTPDDRTLWVTNREADTVSVIDISSLDVAASLPSAAFPIRAAVTPDGRSVLVSHARSGDLAVFDAAGRAERRRVAMPLESAGGEGRLFGDRFGNSAVPIGILVHPDGRRAYVACANADAIAIVDLKAWSVSGWLRAGREPDGMAFSARRAKPARVGP